jgi:hypothetical protein
MRSQTDCRNIAKLEPTTDRGRERWRSRSRWKSQASNELNGFEHQESDAAASCHSHTQGEAWRCRGNRITPL